MAAVAAGRHAAGTPLTTMESLHHSMTRSMSRRADEPVPMSPLRQRMQSLEVGRCRLTPVESRVESAGFQLSILEYDTAPPARPKTSVRERVFNSSIYGLNCTEKSYWRPKWDSRPVGGCCRQTAFNSKCAATSRSSRFAWRGGARGRLRTAIS